MSRHPLRLTLPLFGVLLALSAAPVEAQAPVGAALATRAELETALAEREAWVNSPAYAANLRARARREAQMIRQRLEQGDFRAGDRLVIRLEGSVPFNDTVTVAAGPRITIPGLRPMEIRGALRSELPGRLQQEIRQAVLDATVTVQPLARLAVFGAVTNPGYQLVSYDARVDELLTGAGGPVGDSRPSRFSIMRADTVLVTPDGVAAAIASGQSIGDLALHDGDFLVVKPPAPPWDRATVISVVSIFAAPLLTALLLR